MKFLKSLFAPANSFSLDSISAQAFTESWPQIKAYYEILLKPFNAAEKGKFELIKSDSWILLEKSEALTIESMPSEFRNPKTIETLLTLKKQTALIDELVKKDAADNEIKTALNKLKSIFYSIVELCLSGK